MKEYIRIVQTDAVDEPEMHESGIDVTGLALDSAEVIAIKNTLSELMIAENSKFQKHYHDHDDTNKHRCRLGDI